MADTFEVTMLPASEGDCLVLRYGPSGAERRVIIDTGRKSTYSELKKALPKPADRAIELLVISHVDRDHIEGAVDLLEDDKSSFVFEDIWFNGYDHLDWKPGLEVFGARDGEKVTIALQGDRLPWNKAFAGAPVRIEDDDPLPEHVLPGGLKLTILSPDARKLLKLKPRWEAECKEAGILPGGLGDDPNAVKKPKKRRMLEAFGGESLAELAKVASAADTAKANGSSIALIAEYDGKRILLAADAHPDILLSSLKRYGGGEPVKFDAVKLSHHGSRKNTTTALIKQLRSAKYLVSTSGSIFGHPDREALARVVVHQPSEVVFYFNYDQEPVREFAAFSGEDDLTFECEFPDDSGNTTVSL